MEISALKKFPFSFVVMQFITIIAEFLIGHATFCQSLSFSSTNPSV
jgi:hypothetical protein